MDLTIFEYNRKSFSQRPEDNYVNLGELCATHNKRFNNWMRSKKGKAFLSGLSSATQKSVADELVVSGTNKIGGDAGTWGHPLVAIEVARWISTEFGIWCTQHICTLIETGSTTLADNSQIFSVLMSIHEENRLLRQENQQIQQSILKIQEDNQKILEEMQNLQHLDLKKAAKEVAEKAEEILDEYHHKKALEFKKIRERNEIDRFLRKNR